MGKRRTRYEFLVEIAEGCQKPIGKTDLYHKVKTQHHILTRWLNEAEELKLVEKIGDRYLTTRKGLEFLAEWQKLKNLMQVNDI